MIHESLMRAMTVWLFTLGGQNHKIDEFNIEMSSLWKTILKGGYNMLNDF